MRRIPGARFHHPRSRIRTMNHKRAFGGGRKLPGARHYKSVRWVRGGIGLVRKVARSL